MFIAAQFTIAKCWKQPKCPSLNQWMKKLWYIYTVEYYLATKKKKVLPFVTVWMDLENIMLSEISQSEKDKYRMIPLIGEIMWYLFFIAWLISLSIMFSRSIHATTKGRSSFFLFLSFGWVVFHYVNVP